MTLPPGRHVVFGASAAGVLHNAFLPTKGQVDVDRDDLACGPTRACESLEAWEAMRMRFWNGLRPQRSEPACFSMELADRVRCLHDAPRICLWAGTGLREQLFAARTIHLAEQDRPGPPAIFSLVQFERGGDADDEIISVALLSEQTVRNHPAPVELSSDALQDYRDFWSAATAPDPAPIERFRETRPTAGRHLLDAARLMLRRFPDRQTGMGYWDGRLLSHVGMQPKGAARVIGNTMTTHWPEGDQVGDAYLFDRLLRLGARNLPEPLITIRGAATAMRNTEVQLTAFGRDVLEGRASNHPVNPIDDWIGGTHLSSRNGTLWFRDGEKLSRE